MVFDSLWAPNHASSVNIAQDTGAVSGPRRAMKAAELTKLLAKELSSPSCDIELVQPAIGELHQLYPGWEFMWDGAWGLLVCVPEGVRAIPYALSHAAAYIVRNTPTGYELIKDRENLSPDAKWPPPMLVTKPKCACAGPRTCFERLVGEDDF